MAARHYTQAHSEVTCPSPPTQKLMFAQILFKTTPKTFNILSKIKDLIPPPIYGKCKLLCVESQKIANERSGLTIHIDEGCPADILYGDLSTNVNVNVEFNKSKKLNILTVLGCSL